MRKLSVILITLFLLVACQQPLDIDQSLKEALSMPLHKNSNHSKKYYKYYLPPDMGVMKSNHLSSLVRYKNQDILMNLRVASIVIESYEDINEDKSELEDIKIDLKRVYHEQGQYLNSLEENQTFNLSIYEYNKNVFLIHLQNNQFEFITLSHETQIDEIIKRLFILMQGSSANVDEVVLNYSNKEIVEFKTIHEDFFENIVPESGNLIDMYNQLHPDDKIEEVEE